MSCSASAAREVRTMARHKLRLKVDWIKCDGYGLCGDLLPDVIPLDDWRYPVIPRDLLDRGLEGDLRRAVDCCPMHALALERVAVEEPQRGKRG